MLNTPKYFLAANSAEGFISVFKDCYNPLDGWRVYIIKGGPGTGKSSFMKYITRKAEEKNIIYQLFPCSSDPDSLDAVIFTDIKTVIMDGTAPHTVDPDFPGVCESILNFGAFWDESKLRDNAYEIISLTAKNKAIHRSASNYIKAAGLLIEDNLKTAEKFMNKNKIQSFSNKLIKRYIPVKSGKGYEWVRFISGVTPKGIISFPETVFSHFQNTVTITDNYGAVANEIFRLIREFSLSNGYEIINLKNALLPSTVSDGILIPELSLAFIREYKYIKPTDTARHIHTERFMDLNFSNSNKTKLRANQKSADKLLHLASDMLANAKANHDELEAFYISAMDFDALKEFANKFSEKVLV